MVSMLVYENQTTKVSYEVNGRTISLDKDLVNRFSDVVCPITEKFLAFQIKVFGKPTLSDEVVSAKIGLDMAQELDGYEE